MPDKEAFKILSDMAAYGGVASFGGMANYLYKHSMGMPFKIGSLLVNMFLAGFIGTVVGPLFEPGRLQYAFISISGFSSMYILGFLENKGGPMIVRALSRTFNPDKK